MNGPFPWTDLSTGHDGKLVLLAGRCASCGAMSHPKRQICAKCRADTIEQLEIATEGAVYASTIVRIPSMAGFQTPYACGYVDLDAGIRVFGWFGAWENPPPLPGTRVHAVPATLPGGDEAYRFIPDGKE